MPLIIILCNLDYVNILTHLQSQRLGRGVHFFLFLDGTEPRPLAFNFLFLLLPFFLFFFQKRGRESCEEFEYSILVPLPSLLSSHQRNLRISLSHAVISGRSCKGRLPSAPVAKSQTCSKKATQPILKKILS
jgi:hypothetical protein